jgi:hypothetical protein
MTTQVCARSPQSLRFLVSATLWISVALVLSVLIGLLGATIASATSVPVT